MTHSVWVIDNDDDLILQLAILDWKSTVLSSNSSLVIVMITIFPAYLLYQEP